MLENISFNGCLNIFSGEEVEEMVWCGRLSWKRYWGFWRLKTEQGSRLQAEPARIKLVDVDP